MSSGDSMQLAAGRAREKYYLDETKGFRLPLAERNIGGTFEQVVEPDPGQSMGDEKALAGLARAKQEM